MTTTEPTQQVADKLAIMELVHRFENAFDAVDIDAHMATWAEEMAFESSFGTYTDRNAYKEWVIGFMHQMQAMGGTRHVITNHVIDVHGDKATMFCYLIILNQQKRAIIASSTFQDSLQKIGKEWKFTKRVLQVDQDLAALANG